MEHTVLIVEPDSSRSKHIIGMLIRAGYDALVVSDASEALRQLYETPPDVVILSDGLPADEIDRLSDFIMAMSDLPLVELTNGSPLAAVSKRLSHSTAVTELVETLNELLGR